MLFIDPVGCGLIQGAAHINRLFPIFTQILGAGSGLKVVASPEAIRSLHGDQTDLFAPILAGEGFQSGEETPCYACSLCLRGDHHIVNIETILSGWLSITAVQACGLLPRPGMGQAVANDFGAPAGNQTTGWAQSLFRAEHGLIFGC